MPWTETNIMWCSLTMLLNTMQREHSSTA